MTKRQIDILRLILFTLLMLLFYISFTKDKTCEVQDAKQESKDRLPEPVREIKSAYAHGGVKYR